MSRGGALSENRYKESTLGHENLVFGEHEGEKPLLTGRLLSGKKEGKALSDPVGLTGSEASSMEGRG